MDSSVNCSFHLKKSSFFSSISCRLLKINETPLVKITRLYMLHSLSFYRLYLIRTVKGIFYIHPLIIDWLLVTYDSDHIHPSMAYISLPFDLTHYLLSSCSIVEHFL